MSNFLEKKDSSKKWIKEHKYVVGFSSMPQYPATTLTTKGNKNKDIDIEHVETVEKSSEKENKKTWVQKVKRHYRRFWCCYLVGGIIFLAIFLPLFFIYAFPAIAQLMVDNAALPIYSAMIMTPQPDNVTVSLQAGLTVPAGISVALDPITLYLFNRNVTPIQPYVAVSLPEQHLKGKAHIDISNQTVTILDKDQFIAFLTNAVYGKKFTLSARGSTKAHLGALKAGLTLDKDVELNGLDSLSGFSIESAKLVPKESDGTNLRGVAVLPNHSIVTFALGNVTLNLKVGDLLVGQGLFENVVLTPGNNTVAIKGSVSIATVIDNLAAILSTEKSAISNGDLQLSASGNTTIYEGTHISYYEEILNHLVLTTQIPILDVVFDTLKGLNDSNTTLSGLLNGTNEALASGISDKLANLSDLFDASDLVS